MAQLTISSTSTEYVLVPLGATVGGTQIDPTGDTVQMAFVGVGATPGVSDWQAASWEVNTNTSPLTYSVKCLIGPVGGTITLAPGSWDAWAKVLDNPETVIKRSGAIRIV